MDGPDYDYEELETPAKPKRSRWCLGCCLGLLAVVALACGTVGWFYSTAIDPAVAESRFKDLVPSTVPPGYAGNFSFQMQALEVAVLAAEGSPPAAGIFTIAAIAVPPSGTSAMAQAQLREGLVTHPAFAIQVESTTEVEHLIRGQRVMAEELVGTTQAQTKVRVLFLTITRRADDASAGEVVLIAGGPLADFDQAAWDALLASIE